MCARTPTIPLRLPSIGKSARAASKKAPASYENYYPPYPTIYLFQLFIPLRLAPRARVLYSRRAHVTLSGLARLLCLLTSDEYMCVQTCVRLAQSTCSRHTMQIDGSRCGGESDWRLSARAGYVCMYTLRFLFCSPRLTLLLMRRGWRETLARP